MIVKASQVPAWATTSGDVWAERWPELDRGLAGVAERLDPAIRAAAPAGSFRALDIGCGAGSTSLALAHARPDATIIACDLSPSLIKIAEGRLAGRSVSVQLGDAEDVAVRQRPFELIYSRHGVMFFADPVRAFGRLHAGASPGAGLVFSCFADWTANHWASLMVSAATGHRVDPPAREPGAFAFADAAYARSILEAGGWTDIERQLVEFHYVAGHGEDAVAQALSLFSVVGSASATLRDLGEIDRDLAMKRMRDVIAHHIVGDQIMFPAAACVWTARA